MDEIKINSSLITANQYEKLNNILNKYKNSYPDYKKWKDKKDFYNKENELISLFQFEDYNVGNNNLGYLVSEEKKIQLDDNFIKFIFERFNGLQKCICEKEYYILKNKDKNTSDEIKHIDFFKKELEKLKILIADYKRNECYIESDKEKKIEFVKKICETISWGFEDIFTSCEKFLSNNDLHRKTFGNNKQRVLLNSDNKLYEMYMSCNNFFNGLTIGKFYFSCHNTVEWTILLNKFGVLSAYYKKAPFIRFILNDGLIMPYRRFSQIKSSDIKGTFIGEFNFGPYEFKIYLDNDNFELYDKDNFKILPPLLRSARTVTYTEFRDLLCYLNLPVFRSTVNRNMLFFPNYDMHQRLLAIQGLTRNYVTYTGKNIDWKWFKQREISENEKEAQQQIQIFCDEFKESEDYGIKPVQYEWYEITFINGNTKKYIFLVCSWNEYMTYYSNLEFLIKKTNPNKLYVYNDLIREHAVRELTKTYQIIRVKYIQLKINFDDCTIKKYFFIICSFNEYLINFYKFNYLKKNEDYYVYDYEIEQNVLNKLKEQHGLTFYGLKFCKKYLKYKKKYLELKNIYQSI